jgi:hypothetical protein
MARLSWRMPLLVGAVVLASCTSDPEPPRSSPTPSLRPPSATPTTATGPAAVQDAVAAYRGMWDAYLRALAVPDPARPELARYAAGNALQTLVSGVREVKDRGLKGEGAFKTAPRVTDVAPASAPTKVGIRDCFDDSDARIVRASPGPAHSDPPGGRRLCIASVERQADGAWKVTSFGLRAVGT